MSQPPPTGPENQVPTAPQAGYQQPGYQQPGQQQQPPPYQPWNSASQQPRSAVAAPFIIGLILILVGAYFLLRQFIPQLNLGLLWPLLVVGVGVLLIVTAMTRNRS
jgi:hypothetical protein